MGGERLMDKRAYFKGDVGYFDNPKIVNLIDDHPRAVMLHLKAIAYATQHSTDGVVPLKVVMRSVGAEREDADVAIAAGLLIPTGDRDVAVHDYLKHQRSAAEVKGASEAAKAAAAARWNADRNAERNADSNAGRTDGSDADRNAEKEREKERNTHTSAGASEQLSADFDAWYSAYPRKKNRATAETAYKAARKKPGVTTSLLMDSLIVALEDFRKRPIDKVPYPATWLRAEAWADQPDTDATPTGPYLPHASQIEEPPPGLTPEQYDAWDAEQRARRRSA